MVENERRWDWSLGSADAGLKKVRF